jgi:hypothetical protein
LSVKGEELGHRVRFEGGRREEQEMASEHTEAGKSGGQQPSRAKRPKKTPEEKALEAAAKAEERRKAQEERARARAAEKERKAEERRKAQEEKERARAAEKERKAEEKRRAQEEKARAAAEEKERKRLEKLEQQRKAKEERARAAAEEKERKRLEKLEQQRKAKEEKERAAAAERARLEAQARDGALFVEALKRARSDDNQLVALAEVVKHVPANLKTAFTAHWQQALESGALPSGVSSLRVKGAQSSVRKLLLLSDLSPAVQASSVKSSSSEGTPTGPSSASLKERLLTEFDRLNEANGKRYYVTLFDLRKALPDVSREAFDAALNDLRRDWVLTLSAAEGLHETIPAHVIEAGIVEQSRRLVYVARRES